MTKLPAHEHLDCARYPSFVDVIKILFLSAGDGDWEFSPRFINLAQSGRWAMEAVELLRAFVFNCFVKMRIYDKDLK